MRALSDWYPLLRVEHNGRGVFECGMIEQIALSGTTSREALLPMGDRITWETEGGTELGCFLERNSGAHLPKWRFGCADLIQFRGFFGDPSFRRDLADRGAKVVIYAAHPKWVRFGRYQAIFHAPHAEKHEELCPTEVN